MKEQDNKEKESPADSAEEGRRVYDKPRILFRQKLEAVAVACDPNQGGKDVVPDNCDWFASS
jgi:hypothetical protein